MLRTLLDARTLVALAVALTTGMWGLRAYPSSQDDEFLALVAVRRPDLHQAFLYTYAVLWFSTPFFVASLVESLVAIVAYRHAPRLTYRSLPAYTEPEVRPALSLVLGEVHHHTRPGRAPDPTWLILPFLRPTEDLLQAPSVTEVMVHGAGHCVFVEQRRRGGRPDRTLK